MKDLILSQADPLVFLKENFGVVKSDLEKALSVISRGADFVDIYIEYRVLESFDYEENQLKETNESIVKGVGIRVVRGDKTYLGSTVDVTPAGIMRVAKNIALKEGDKRKIELQYRHPDLNLYPVKLPAELYPLKKKIEILKKASSAASKHALVERVKVSLKTTEKLIVIVNSEGLLTADYQPMIGFSVSVIASKNGRVENGAFRTAARSGYEYLGGEKTSLFGKEALKKALEALRAINAPAGVMDVVLSPGHMGVLLHEAFGHGLEADCVRKENSVFAGMIDKRVGSELVTVIDDGTIKGARGSINIDDEGTKTERTILIEKGILKNYISDRLSARLMGIRPTGNGRRENFSQLPIPRMRNTFMIAGESKPKDIIKSVKYGIYAGSMMGGEVDPVSGKFVFSLRDGYLIENGKMTKPIKCITLTGNCADTLKNVVMVGNDWCLSYNGGTCGKEGQWVPVDDGIPTVKIKNMTVGGTDVGNK